MDKKKASFLLGLLHSTGMGLWLVAAWLMPVNPISIEDVAMLTASLILMAIMVAAEWAAMNIASDAPVAHGDDTPALTGIECRRAPMQREGDTKVYGI